MKAIKLFKVIGNMMLSESKTFDVKIQQEDGSLVDSELVVDRKGKVVILKPYH